VAGAGAAVAVVSLAEAGVAVQKSASFRPRILQADF